MTTDTAPPSDIIFSFTDDPDGSALVGERCAAFAVIDEDPPIRWLTESEVRGLVKTATAWLDAPRLAARRAPEIVAAEVLPEIADCARPAIALVRTAAGEWGVGCAADLTDDVELDGDDAPEWFTGPTAEHAARTLYASERGKALCVCGVECDEDEIDRGDDEPMCPACVKAAQEEFLVTKFRCGYHECSGNPCHGHTPCGWTGTGADLIAHGQLDNDADHGMHECPKCFTHSVEEIETTQPEATK